MAANKFSAAEIDDLKSRHRCDDLAAQWGVTLRRLGDRMIGPCPICSPDPTSRDATRFEAWADRWVCAVCCDGGDVIRLVRLREGLSFIDAVDYLGGTRQVDPAVAAAAEEKRARIRAEREAASKDYRERERQRLWGWFHPAEPIGPANPAGGYFSVRGLKIPPASPARLRYAREIPYFHGEELDERGLKRPRIIYRGPAMLAAIVDAGGTFRALHITWIDTRTPKGKAEIRDPDTGEIVESKKVRGSKAGHAIEVVPVDAPRRLVMGEGIETVAAVYSAWSSSGLPIADVAFWAAVDLGNIGGKSADKISHPTLKTETGRVRKVPGLTPDPDSAAIVIPDSVEEVILLGDGDSDRLSTHCALYRGAQRFKRAGRKIRLAWAPAGKDFNDMRAGGLGDREILDLIEAAAEIAAPEIPNVVTLKNKDARRQPRDTNKPSSEEEAAADKSADVVAFPAAPLDGPAAPPRAPAGGEGGGESASSRAVPKDRRRGAGTAVTERRNRDGNGVGRRGDYDDIDLSLAFFPQTDLGNAERFRERNRGRFIFCPAIGWLFWDGQRWARDGADELVKIAVHQTVRAIQDEADALADSGRDVVVGSKGKGDDVVEIMLSDQLRGWGRASEGASRLAPIDRHAAGYLAVKPTDLDADPFMINVANGTIVIRRTIDGSDPISFKDHDPGDLITKVAPVSFDPAATCPLWDQFLGEVQPAEDVRRFIYQWKGLSLTGDTTEQRMVLNWGNGKNGKSVCEDVTAAIAGDYSASTPIETFLAEGRGRNAGQATPDLAMLPGVRMLRTSEPKRNALLDEALIKLATGGEEITARHLNRDYFKYYPQFKLSISGNYRPRIEGGDEGIWRRMILVPWTYTVPEAKRDKKLAEKLKAEAAGILNRMLDGLRDWLDGNGLAVPEAAVAATAEYRQDSDPLGRFITACVATKEGGRVQSSALHALFLAWSKANSGPEWSNRGFTAAMKERGFHTTKDSVMYFVDIATKANVADFVDANGKPRDARDPPPHDEIPDGPGGSAGDDEAVE